MTNDNEPQPKDPVFTIRPEADVTFLDLHAILEQARSLLLALERTEDELEPRVQENVFHALESFIVRAMMVAEHLDERYSSLSKEPAGHGDNASGAA